MKKIAKNTIKTIIFIVFSVILFLSIYIKKTFNNVSVEQLIYSALNSEGTSFSAIYNGIIFVSGFTILSFVIYKSLKYIITKITKNLNVKIDLRIKNANFITNLFKPTNRKTTIHLIIFCILSLTVSVKTLGIDTYLKFLMQNTKLFDTYYVNPKDVQVIFPEKKKNLIYIYVESLETTATSKLNGGIEEVSYIPNLEKLAKENTNFSNTDKLGGALHIDGAGWTVASMIAQTSGIPLKLSIEGNSYKNFGSFLPGAYSLGEILESNGYKNYLMIGSDADFGGRKDYFTYHGNYKILDYHWAKDMGFIDSNYYVWWGYEDKKLFEYAKSTLLDISKADEPFNFTLLTADTHFFDGYLDDTCDKPFDSQYANAHFCSDSMIYEFIEWLKGQDFYDNTTIIITGDHLTMQSGFYNISNDYQRTIYNTFINSSISSENTNYRLFSLLDMYPTTLAAMGAIIDGNRLGLGVNLFSDEQTLFEKLGYNYVSEELMKKSFFYDNYLLGDTYYKMQ